MRVPGTQVGVCECHIRISREILDTGCNGDSHSSTDECDNGIDGLLLVEEVIFRKLLLSVVVVTEVGHLVVEVRERHFCEGVVVSA